MALSQSDVDALDRAIATGELEVEFDGMRRRFRSVSELIAARAHVSAVLAGAGSSSSGSRPAVYLQPSFTTARGD
jgi:hypothetical protein